MDGFRWDYPDSIPTPNLDAVAASGREYAIRDREAVEDGYFYGGEPIWVTAEKQGVKSASYFWVGSEAGECCGDA